ncbi:hypothetical protein BGZ54_007556 [Gamsiella multidivaricata]|nr:hypothetical protein BGZ54_007556 [Gamsiella multidivaricata]
MIVVLILTLPLNLIPILGQILYAFINGWILTFGVRFHYDAEIRNISVAQSRREAWKRRSEYSGFGSVAVALEMIPIANLLFMWTNIVGCALWVADEIEREERRHQQQVAQDIAARNNNISNVNNNTNSNVIGYNTNVIGYGAAGSSAWDPSGMDSTATVSPPISNSQQQKDSGGLVQQKGSSWSFFGRSSSRNQDPQPIA